MTMSWTAWIALAVVAIVALFVRAWISYRKGVREDFVKYLRANHPEVGIGTMTFNDVVLRMPDGKEGTLSFHRLYGQLAQIDASDAAGREAAFASVAGAILESGSAHAVEPGRDRPRLRPRIMRSELVLRAQPDGAPGMVHGSFGVEGLSVVLVLDSEHSVAYVTEETLKDLHLSFADALAVAKENLRTTTPPEIVRKVIDGGALSVCKTMDTYDAARVLVVPEHLRPGERLVALVPDRDTLALATLPKNSDWSSLEKLARNAAGDPLWTKPLIVSPDGVASYTHV